MSTIKATEQTLLHKYLGQLALHPLRTKAITNATLNGIQEVTASYLAGEKTKDGSYVSDRVPKMMAYGAFVSAPLSHFLVTTLQKVFEGKTTTKDKILQIIASNLIVSPIQNTAFISCMAIIAGARNTAQIKGALRTNLLPIMKISWMTSPLALIFAQKFLAPEAWVPFFNAIAFVFGTYINTQTKRQMRLRRAAEGK
ncbi:hypothetical protein BCR37DRAFT_166568 [Protomyces lactucae-debilis]|uniref:Integral membrane protein n=1 Tax=Protomyces lactucae-debilis TaxID=2754530 RepID=A0A1Y2EXR6_PROLT|nr:uncharacterized protein BCR37DRAFT_166568 [Protomyces lactucae-debilis]ORY76024.1 hypothetical protein BCR37DRAFT_166568 [Protomyces lactucae-debilis]